MLIAKGSTGILEFRHADGTTYGESPQPGTIDATARALKGLRNLGFGEREARDAIQQARAHVGIEVGHRDEVSGPTNHGHVESLIRSALELLTRDRWENAS